MLIGLFAMVTLRGVDVGLNLRRAHRKAANRMAIGQPAQATGSATSLAAADSQTPVTEDIPAGAGFPGEEQAESGMADPTLAAQDSGSADQAELAGDDNGAADAAVALRTEIATARSRDASTAQATVSRPKLAIDKKLRWAIDGIPILVNRGFSSIVRSLASAMDTAQPIVRQISSNRFPEPAIQTPASSLPREDVTESIAQSSVAQSSVTPPSSVAPSSVATTSETEERAADKSEEKIVFAPGTTVISNQATGVVHCMANGDIYSLQPGEIHVLREEGPRLIQFHRGNDSGDASIKVEDGHYDFVVSDGAWDLKARDLAASSD